jgi:monofunctional biosynthetic peptidoglycan transglycosylase
VLPAEPPPIVLPRPDPKPAPGIRRYLRLALRAVALLLLATTMLVLALVVLYRWVDPPTSTLMLGQRLTGTPIRQRWVPLARISPNLQLAAVVSEDARFCRHRGVDWGEIRDAIEQTRDGTPRGGSTITMQVAKNLFLWPSKSYLRKAVEIGLAYLIEAAWPKRRILEVYLNIAEWGPGVFGAEAAARYHFRKPAMLLSAREASLLAVALPNPFEREAGSPGPGTQRLADHLLMRVRAAQGNAACVRAAAAGDRSQAAPRIVPGHARRERL